MGNSNIFKFRIRSRSTEKLMNSATSSSIFLIIFEILAESSTIELVWKQMSTSGMLGLVGVSH